MPPDNKPPNLDDIDPREFIIALRGGIPPCCDFCGQKTPEDDMEPEEAGMWVCRTCLRLWEEENPTSQPSSE